VSGEVVNEGFAAVVVEVDAAVDVGEHSIEFVRDGDAAATSAIAVFVATLTTQSISSMRRHGPLTRLNPTPFDDGLLTPVPPTA